MKEGVTKYNKYEIKGDFSFLKVKCDNALYKELRAIIEDVYMC